MKYYVFAIYECFWGFCTAFVSGQITLFLICGGCPYCNSIENLKCREALITLYGD